MSLLKLSEKILRKKVARAGRKNIVKLTTDKKDTKVVGGKEERISSKEKKKRERGAREGAKKRKAKLATALIRRKKTIGIK